MNNIILVGNPNTGKTTLFNTLTKSNEKASNWHGVTVNVKNRRCKIGEYDFLVYDVPGMYSLNAYSNEEKIASEFLSKNKDALIVNICDANNIERNLKLTIELIEEGYNIVLAVNMVNENNNINYKLLERELGVVVIPIDARSLKSVLSLCKIVNNIINKKSQKTIKTGKILYNNNQLINNFAKFQKDKNYNPYKITDKIDKFVLNKWLFVPLFLVSLLMIFYITFGSIGMCFSNIFNMFFNKTFGILRKIILCTNMSYIIKSVICDGLFVGIESVVSFIPQIVLLIFFLNLLEDTGIMSRIAFMFDGVLKKIGLTGKSLFSLMLGLGCTTTAVLTTRNLENRQLRKRTVLLLPFISCSAKLPVFLVISSLFFEKYKFIFVFLLYLFSIAIAVIFASIYKKIMPDNNDLFLLEMPKYRFPNIKKITKDTYLVVKEFLIKIGTIILFFTFFVWILQNFTITFKFLSGQNFEKSILYFLSEKLLFIFQPLGINSVGIVVALILGVIAKEMIIVGLAMINGVAGAGLSASLISSYSLCYFSPVTSIVFLIFVLIYSPCISSLATIKNELGIKTSIYVFVAQFIIAYVASFFVYKFLIDYTFIFAILFFIILAVLLSLVLRLKKKNDCWGDCSACKKC